MSYLDRIAACNTHEMGHFRPFFAGEERVGWIKPPFAAKLTGFPGVFRISDNDIRLHESLDSYDARTDAVADVLRQLADNGDIPGLRSEMYRVGTRFTGPQAFEMDRVAVEDFGVRAYGVHITGYVREGDDISIWVGIRALDKPTFPGELDNFVAGGQPAGLALFDNVIKESAEEAGVPEALARTTRPAGAISYVAETERGLKPDTMYVYDIELPADFQPINTDGEIASFELWPAADVLRRIETTTDFKFNCNLVNLDFAIRHGLIRDDHPDYAEIVRGLHR